MVNKFDVFESWLVDNGAEFTDLSLRVYEDDDAGETLTGGEGRKDFTGGKVSEEKKGVDNENYDDALLNASQEEDENEMRGVHANADIPPNTVCVAVPRKCLITVEMGKATSIGQAVLKANVELDAPKHIFIMLFLLIDKKDPNSFFKPYYDILPKTLRNMPIFWDEEELAELEGSYLLQQIDDRNAAIEEDYASICNISPELSAIATLEEFKWARMCVCSRNFGLLINGVRTSALVPHADMLNHFRPRETKWTFDNERQAFTITTLQTVRSGCQIYDSYGQKCNHRFLLNYGFAIEHNCESDGFCPNEVPIELAISEEDEEYEAKIGFWCREGSSPVKRVRVAVSNNDNTKTLLSMLRVAVASKADLHTILSSGPYMYRTAKDIRFALSVANERLALQHLYDVVKKCLAAYPTTLAEDNNALLHGDLPPFSNKRNARIQIRGEKEVLHHYLDFAETGLSVIDLKDEKEFNAEIELIQSTRHNCIAQYCGDVIGAILREEARREK